MALTSILLKIMLLIFFHENLLDFRGLEKYWKYRPNHWKQGCWEDKRWNPTSVTADSKKQTEKYYLLKNFRGSMKQTPRSSVLRLRHGVLPLAQFCYILKIHVSKFDPCK